MEISHRIGYVLAVFVGISLGMLGSGGSILSVPILVYVLGVEPVLATAYSLFIVGTSAMIGGIQKARQQLVDFKKVVLFGVPTLIAVFITRKCIVPNIPEILFSTATFTLQKSVFIMIVFATVMIVAALKMIKPIKEVTITDGGKLNYFAIFFQGLLIGCIAGFVGAGGGFLLIPALVYMAKTPMKIAVGTSLFIVSTQSLIGFLGDVGGNESIDWQLIITFTSCACIGIFIGNHLSKKIAANKLKIAFGWFVLLMGIYIIIKELIIH